MKKRTILMLILCCLSLVSVTYSWFSNVSYKGGMADYKKNLIIGGGNVTIENYSGEMVNEDTTYINYTEIPETGIVINGLYPGVRQFFKTVIKNTGNQSMTISVLLSSIEFDPELKDYISVVATSPLNIVTTGKDCDAKSPEDTNTRERISGVLIGDRLTVGAGESVAVVWHIKISEEATNDTTNPGKDCTGKKVIINAVKTSSS